MAQNRGPKEQSNWDKLRGATLGCDPRTEEIVELDTGNGEKAKFLLRSPSNGDIDAANIRAGIKTRETGEKDENGNAKLTASFERPLLLQVLYIMATVRDPESGKLLYGPADEAVLMSYSPSGWLRELSDRVGKFIAAKPEEMAKNSEAAAVESASSTA